MHGNALPQGLVERPRLFEILDEVISSRVTLVVAPAGYGKTVLLLDWMAHRQGMASVYVPLDERHNDLGYFWNTLTTELSERVPGVLEDAPHMANSVSAGSVELLIQLICERLLADGRPIVVVLDDIHHIHQRAVLDSIDLLLDEMPDSVHIIAVGRHDPPLTVRVLRVRGHLTEIREADLRFTLAEVTDLVSISGITLAESGIQTLREDTDGWAAALRLALLAAEQAPDAPARLRTLSESKEWISDYLLEEVVHEMAPEQQEFLYSTCVVSELDDELGAALSGRDDAADILNRLALEHTLVSPITEREGWFRYHRLLRDMLQVRLQAGDAGRFRKLHRLAGAWHLEHGDPAVAVHHAIVAGDIEEAEQRLTRVALSLGADGRGATVVELSGRIMAATGEPSALTLLTRFSALYVVGESQELDEVAERLEVKLKALPQERATPSEPVNGGSLESLLSPGFVPSLRGLMARARGDLPALLRLDDAQAIPSPGGQVEGCLAEGLMWIERYDQARPFVRVFQEHAAQERYRPFIAHGLALEAILAIGDGNLGQADAVVARALKIAADDGFGQAFFAMYPRLVATALAWVRGELLAAEDTAVALQRFSERSADVPIVVQQAIFRSRIRLSLGDSLGARSLLDRASVMATGRLVGGHFAERLALAHAMLDLLDDEFESAEHWLPDWRKRLAAGPETTRERLVLLRLLIASGEDTSALHEPVPGELHHGPFERIEHSRLRALALLQKGSSRDAREVLTESLRRARQLGVVQPIIDDRHRLAPILAEASREAGWPPPSAIEDPPQPQATYVEPLSRREHTVLGLMATHRSYPEIADELFISPSTVRTHVKAIFRKLAVNRRSEAVARGRAYGLIEKPTPAPAQH